MRTLLLLALVAVTGAGVTACGSSNSPSSSAASHPSHTSTGSGGSAHRCADVPASRVNPALGLQVEDPTEVRNGPVTVCTYEGSPQHLIIRFETDVDSLADAKQQSAQTGQKPQDLSGLGDEAFSSSIGNGAYVVSTVTARKGSLEVLVTSHAPLDKEVALAKQLLG